MKASVPLLCLILAMSSALADGPPPSRPCPKHDQCKAYSSDRIADRLETYVFALPSRPKGCMSGRCCIVPDQRVLISVRKGETRQIAIRSVYFDRLDKPKPAIPVSITAIDDQGTPLNGRLVILENPVLVTSDDGFADFTFRVSEDWPISNVGLFRFRLDHKDREVQQVSYSPYVRVIKSRPLRR